MRALWLVLLLLSAAWAQTATPTPSPPRVFTLQDNAKRIRVQPGETFKVRLPADPSSGLQWELHYKNSQLKRVGEPAFQANKPGPAGVVIYTFEVEGQFEDSLELRYLKPGAKKPKPARVYTLQLRVADGS